MIHVPATNKTAVAAKKSPSNSSYQSVLTVNLESPQEEHATMGPLEQDGLFHYENHTDNDSESSTSSPTAATTKTTARQSWIHLLKGYIGPGCLSLPWAVSQLGILPGAAACLALSWWSSHNCWTVVQLKRHYQSELTSQRNENEIDNNGAVDESLQSITYPDVAGWLYGSKMQQFTTACVCTQQLAICTVFLSFCGANLQAVLQACAAGTEFANLSHAAVITMVLPTVLALSCLPNLKALAPVTAAGTALLLVGLGFLLLVVALEWKHPDTDPEPVTTQWSQVPLALCAILYSYEGINLILPIESAMAMPGKFGGVFWSAMVVTAIVFALTGGLCVAAFGAVNNGSVTAFLLEVYADNTQIRSILLAANAAVSLSVLVTYPLQLFPCLELVGPLLAPKASTSVTPAGPTFQSLRDEQDIGPGEMGVALERAAFQGGDGDVSVSPSQQDVDVNDASSWRTRTALVMLTYMIAIVIPNVQSLISLAGALAGSSTALLIPPALELAWLDRTSDDVSKKMRAYTMLAGGFIFLCIGTGASLLDIISDYTSGSDD